MKNVLMRFWYDLLQYLRRLYCQLLLHIHGPEYQVCDDAYKNIVPKVVEGDLVLHRKTGRVAVVTYSFVNADEETILFVYWINGWKGGPRILRDSEIIKMNY